MQIVSFNHPEQKTSSTLQVFFYDELRMILWCELMMKEMIPFLIKQSMSDELSRSMAIFFLETQKAVGELEDVFSLLELQPEERECDVVNEMVESVWSICSSTARGRVRDAGILLIAQKILGFQIVSYRTLSMYLRRMKQLKAAYLVEGILSEKKNTDNKFHNLSASINYITMVSENYKEPVLHSEF